VENPGKDFLKANDDEGCEIYVPHPGDVKKK